MKGAPHGAPFIRVDRLTAQNRWALALPAIACLANLPQDGSMSDNDVNLIRGDRATLIDDLLAEVPIEPGKVGHRTVLSAGGARVIVLSFDRGQQMKEHRSHHPLLLHAVDGHVRIAAAGQVMDLRPGGLVYLPNALAHSVEAIEPSRITLTPIGIESAPPAPE